MNTKSYNKVYVFIVFALLILTTGLACGGGTVTQSEEVVGHTAINQPPEEVVAPAAIDQQAEEVAPTSINLIPSQWQGEIQGQVYDQSFTLPVIVKFANPLPNENNPVGFLINAGDPSQIGNLALASAAEASTFSGSVTLQYFSVEAGDTQLQGTLVNDHRQEAAAFNQFVAPNVTAEHVPGVGGAIYQDFPTEIFIFLEGTVVTINLSGESLTGSIRGTGQSLVGIFPIPDVNYQAEFSATRTR